MFVFLLQVEESLDWCRVYWSHSSEGFLISTDYLLRIGDQCISEGDDAFSQLYEIVIMRRKHLENCLIEYAKQVINIHTYFNQVSRYCFGYSIKCI